MKKGMVVFLLALALWGCANAPAPQVELDERKPAQTEVAEATSPGLTAESALPEVASAPPEQKAPAEEAIETQGLSQRVIAAWEGAGYLEDMAPYSSLDFLDLYGIEAERCASAAGYAAGYTEEIVLVEADEETAAAVEELLQKHLERVRDQFRSYDAAALALAERAVLVREKGVVLMIMSPDAEDMLRLFREQAG